MSRWIFFVIVFLLSGHSYAAKTLAPFSSDGCSMFPDGTLSQPVLWLHCCIEHDRAYWMGGTEKQRQQTDQQFEQCIAATGKSDLAAKMRGAVEIGGSPDLPTPFRWGYGWSELRPYAPLNKAERLLILERLMQEQKALEKLREELDGR